jgi:hypothetical protein
MKHDVDAAVVRCSLAVVLIGSARQGIGTVHKEIVLRKIGYPSSPVVGSDMPVIVSRDSSEHNYVTDFRCVIFGPQSFADLG